MSEERRTVLEIELEEAWNNYEGVMEEWAEGYISYDEAREEQARYWAEIQDLSAALRP